MDTLQIIAEPRRRRILQLLWRDELAAGDIADQFNVSFPAVSQHLAVLRGAGLVSVRKDGNRRIYSANQAKLEPYRDILESMWAATLDDLARAVES